jgi:hypothetical protein
MKKKSFVGIHVENEQLNQMKEFIKKQEFHISMNCFINQAIRFYLEQKNPQRINYFKVAEEKLERVLKK